MEKCIIWLADLALWIVMRVVFVTEPFRVTCGEPHIADNPKIILELPQGDEDLSVAIAIAKEFLDDQVQSTGVILEKFKAIMGMYSFSVPILIGFISQKISLLPHWGMAVIGILVCTPGFCMMRYFSIKTYISPTLSQEDISQSFRKQQIDQINWFYAKGEYINSNNNHNVNIYYATQRWLGITLVTLLAMAFWLTPPPTPLPPASSPNIFNNFFLAQNEIKSREKKQIKLVAQSLASNGNPQEH